MKRIILIVTAIIMTMASCETNTQPKKSVQQKKHYVIQTIIDSCFVGHFQHLYDICMVRASEIRRDARIQRPWAMGCNPHQLGHCAV